MALRQHSHAERRLALYARQGPISGSKEVSVKICYGVDGCCCFLATRHFLGRVERQNQKTLPDVNRCRCEDITKMAAEIQFHPTECRSLNQWFLTLPLALTSVDCRVKYAVITVSTILSTPPASPGNRDPKIKNQKSVVHCLHKI